MAVTNASTSPDARMTTRDVEAWCQAALTRPALIPEQQHTFWLGARRLHGIVRAVVLGQPRSFLLRLDDRRELQPWLPRAADQPLLRQPGRAQRAGADPRRALGGESAACGRARGTAGDDSPADPFPGRHRVLGRPGRIVHLALRDSGLEAILVRVLLPGLHGSLAGRALFQDRLAAPVAGQPGGVDCDERHRAFRFSARGTR